MRIGSRHKRTGCLPTVSAQKSRQRFDCPLAVSSTGRGIPFPPHNHVCRRRLAAQRRGASVLECYGKGKKIRAQKNSSKSRCMHSRSRSPTLACVTVVRMQCKVARGALHAPSSCCACMQEVDCAASGEVTWSVGRRGCSGQWGVSPTPPRVNMVGDKYCSLAWCGYTHCTRMRAMH